MAALQLGSFGELDIQAGNLILKEAGGAQLASVSIAEVLELVAQKSSNAAVKEALELAKQALIAMTP